jgi:hypothetical protein
MQRTVTGNSIHYVLDSMGRPLDAIPGLYQPPAFLALLRDGVALHEALRTAKVESSRDQALRRYHANAIFATRKNSPRLSLFSPANDYAATRTSRVTAWLTAAPAPTKDGGEIPVLERISLDARAYAAVAELANKAERIVRGGPRTIDANARALIQAKRAASPDPGMRSAASLDAVLAKLEQTLEADTRLNEGSFHQTIHRWFVYDDVANVDALNNRAYSELFLAPRSDPWMGLVSDNSFTGLSGEGLRVMR